MKQVIKEIPIIDPFGIAADPEMPFLAQALDPAAVQRQFTRHLTPTGNGKTRFFLHSIRVNRYKPGRRCLIEYAVFDEITGQSITLVGKAHRKNVDWATYELQRCMWNAGFGENSPDGVRIPEPVGTIPETHMWLQRQVIGRAATQAVAEPGAEFLARRIAGAFIKLHSARMPTSRKHGMVEELQILHKRMRQVALAYPQWSRRLQRVMEACDQLGKSIPEPELAGIQRDAYADHVIVDGEQLYLLDFDLFCTGDRGLDIGNFNAHLIEQALRTYGDAAVLQPVEREMEDHYVELAAEGGCPPLQIRRAIQIYAVLTLVRHISLSTQISDRLPNVEKLIELCEQQLI